MIAPARPYTVLMTTDTLGGVWTYAVELCAGLAQRDVRVVLATMGAPLSADQWAAVRGLKNVTIEQSTFRLEWMDKPWLDVDRAGRWLRDLARRFHPDVVHLNGYVHASLPFDAPVLVVAHSDVLTWWRAVHGRPAPADWNRYRMMVRAGLHGASEVVAPTRAMLAELEACYGALPRTRVIPNGRRPDAFRPAAKAPLVLAAGRLWDEAKNIGALCDAAEGLPWPVCVAGSRRHPEGRLAVLPNVRELGTLGEGEMAGWYARAAIYAHPARYEPFGLCVLEAALSECALVLADIATLHEVWGDAAVYIPPDDPSALRDALRALVADPARRRRMGARARRRAERFTADAMAARYLAAYRALGTAALPHEEVTACAS